ncbi:MAG: UbiD family decarboxylase [Rhodospirillales bacterium]
MVFGDLRGWIDALRREGEIRDVNATVDWDIELAVVTRKAMSSGHGPALLFNSIKDYDRPDSRCRRFFTAGLSNYRRLAMMFGLDKDASVRDIIARSRDAMAGRVAPKVVSGGPVKEVVVKGDDVNLFDFPAPRWHRLDGGRYLTTFAGGVSKDPDTGLHNVGVYRGMIDDRNSMPIAVGGSQHMAQHLRKYARDCKEMPVAFVYGWEPCLPFCASAPIPPDVCEYDVMGSIRGAPVELVPCETVDLLVPATAEVVVEGYVSADEETFRMEGPFGEYAGYFAGDRKPKSTVRVTCITHRRDPIMRGTLEGTLPKMLNENSIMSSVQRAAVAWNVLDRAGVPGITDVHCAAANNGTTLFIQMRQTYRGQAKQAAAAIWGSNASIKRYKNIWVVDEDIDIRDYGALDWAFAYRVNAAEDDIVIFPSMPGSPLDPSTRLKYRSNPRVSMGKWSRVLIDATVNLDFDAEEQYGGKLYPDSVMPHPDDVAMVEKRWSEYGI